MKENKERILKRQILELKINLEEQLKESENLSESAILIRTCLSLGCILNNLFTD